MNLYNTNSIPLGLIYLQLNYWKLTYKESENYEGSGDASKMVNFADFPALPDLVVKLRLLIAATTI